MKLINCPECGARIPADSRNCPECGYDLTELKNTAVRKKSHKKLYAILLTACVAVLLLFFLLPDQKSGGDIPANEATEPVQVKETAAKIPAEPEKGTSGKNEVIANVGDMIDSYRKEKTKSLAGVYESDEGGVLVLRKDGRADYYCADKAFTELSCRWENKENVITIELEKLHCTIEADTSGGFETLSFESGSRNWEKEVFKRLDVTPEQYGYKEVISDDPALKVENDGTMTYGIGGYTFVIPKHYRDQKNSFGDGYKIFVDVDVDKDTVSSLLFCTYGEEYRPEEIKDKTAAYAGTFVQNILEDTVVSDEARQIEFSGKDAYIIDTEGNLNSGFGPLTGTHCQGKTVITETAEGGKIFYILFLQSENDKNDYGEEFEKIFSGTKWH